jgi:HlyD family secretion protein
MTFDADDSPSGGSASQAARSSAGDAPSLGSPTGQRQDRASRRRRRSLAVWIAGGLALLTVLAWAFRPQAVPADLAPVERQPMEVTLDEEGETRVRDRYQISAPVAGKVLRIELEPGDPVVAGGTVLASFQPAALDPRTLAESEARLRAARSARDQARAELERSRAELAQSEVEAERYRRLSRERIVSEERLDAVELDLTTRRRMVEAARFRLQTAGHQLEQAEAALLHTRGGGDGEPLSLTSPIDGVVLTRRRESEAVVAAGEPLLEVGDPSRLEIVADFLSSDAVRIAAGDPVHVEQWGGEARLEGTVRRVEPSGFTKVSALGVEEQRVNVIIDFVDPRDGWEKLGDGYRVEVLVVVWREDDVLQVPSSALFRSQDGWAVFTVDGENGARARRTPVEVGHRNGLQGEVRSGLEAGDTVIVHPSDAISDGVKVEQRGG